MPYVKEMVNTDGYTEYVTIGKIVKAHGIHGEIKVVPLTVVPDRFERVKTMHVHLMTPPDCTIEIEHVRYYKRLVYLTVKNRTTLESVQPFIGGELQIPRVQAPPLPEGVYYHFEIIGAEVLTDDAKRLGEIVDILELGCHDVYVVQGEEREYLIPARAEIITQIDRQKKKVIIHPLEGLLDL